MPTRIPFFLVFFLVFFLLTGLASTLPAEVFEKIPGATNPKVSETPGFVFHCNPPEKKISITALGKATVEGPGKTRAFRLRKTTDDDQFSYIECFAMGDSLVVVHQEEDSENTSIHLVRLSLKTFQEEWRRQLLGLNLGPPLLTGDAIYVSWDNKLARIDPKTGKELWKKELPCTSLEEIKEEGKKLSFTCRDRKKDLSTTTKKMSVER